MSYEHIYIHLFIPYNKDKYNNSVDLTFSSNMCYTGIPPNWD